MSVTYTTRRTRVTIPHWLIRGLIALVGGVILFLFLVVLWVTGYNMVYAGRIYPGVSVASISLEGISPDFVPQANSPPFLAHIQQNTCLRRPQGAHGLFQLFTAITAQ